ncbi:MAG: putative oxygen-independent coproporphyrinogen III oxidase [Saprospiraceae bacterium]|jgi:putative oxygen-independent coproporphyrinogen III oxidase
MQSEILPDIPLGLYIHFPWCVQKCPYCDFNSHAQKAALPQAKYTQALITQFRALKKATNGRTIETVFIGGGTPSLIQPQYIQNLLDVIRSEADVVDDVEITLEANPGTLDESHFAGYLKGGVNRLSIGVQSFNNAQLKKLGRIHDAGKAHEAITLAKQVGFTRINIDLMYGLPSQTLAMAQQDLSTALAADVEHISLYQLTIEPNTQFAVKPPTLPNSERCWDMHLALMPLLEEAQYDRYEVSAFAKKNQACRHNLNYWNFGDYLAIGAGGHAKLSQQTDEELKIQRYWNKRHPKAYIEAADSGSFIGGDNEVPEADRTFEFLMNSLRLKQGFDTRNYPTRTGLSESQLQQVTSPFIERGWLEEDGNCVRPTEEGYRYIDEMLLTTLPQK